MSQSTPCCVNDQREVAIQIRHVSYAACIAPIHPYVCARRRKNRALTGMQDLNSESPQTLRKIGIPVCDQTTTRRIPRKTGKPAPGVPVCLCSLTLRTEEFTVEENLQKRSPNQNLPKGFEAPQKAVTSHKSQTHEQEAPQTPH